MMHLRLLRYTNLLCPLSKVIQNHIILLILNRKIDLDAFLRYKCLHLTLSLTTCKEVFSNCINIGCSRDQFNPIFVSELTFFNGQRKTLRPLKVLVKQSVKKNELEIPNSNVHRNMVQCLEDVLNQIPSAMTMIHKILPTEMRKGDFLVGARVANVTFTITSSTLAELAYAFFAKCSLISL